MAKIAGLSAHAQISLIMEGVVIREAQADHHPAELP
jgi:hypothetical protein